jgi:hypothetical protein
MVRAWEEQEAAAAQAEAARVAAAQARRRLQLELIRDVEKVAAEAAADRAAERLAALEARWSAEAGDADAELAGRFETAQRAARDAMAQVAAEREARERARRATEAQLQARRALIARCRELAGDTSAEAQALLVAEWEGLPVVDHPESRQLQADFDAALRGVEKKRRDEATAGERLARVAEIATALEGLAADDRFPGHRELRQRVRRLRQEAQAAGAEFEHDARAAEALGRIASVGDALAAKEQAWREAQNAEAEQRKRQAQQTLQRLIDLGKLETPTLKALERAIADARAVEASLESEPADPERAELKAKVAAAREALQPTATSLREADDWQRWANAGVQEQLIAKMEALAADAAADAGAAVRQMREMQDQWKAVASAPRDRAEQLWTRFRAAAQAVRERVEPLRAAQRAEQTEHLARKIALCEKAEALSESTEWIATADALKALQAEWKTIGPAPRRDEQAVWERFRNACNRFFTRRQDDLKQRKQVWTGNLEKKEALIARAEALTSTTDWEAGFAELKALQAEWKATGPVKKSKSEQVWQKFRAACDAFMERYRTRDSQQFADRLSRREAVAADLEALAEGVKNGTVPPEGLLERVRSIRTGWQQAGSAPREVLRPVATRFDAALGVILAAAPDAFRHTELDVDANRGQLEQLCERVEKIASRQPAPAAASPASVLATQLREALAANTIGGRADDEQKWKNADYEIRSAQEAWQRVGYVPDAIAAPLAARFHRATQRFYGDRKGPQGGAPRGGRRA